MHSGKHHQEATKQEEDQENEDKADEGLIQTSMTKGMKDCGHDICALWEAIKGQNSKTQ